MTPSGNAKHRAAAAATADRVVELRALIREQLTVLVDLEDKLQLLTSTRQSGGAGYLSADAAAVRDRVIRDDRAAVRGQGLITEIGKGWLNATESASTGPSPAPLAIPAVSVSAEILFTVQHHVRRLGRPARQIAGTADTAAMLAQMALDTTELQRGWCHWPQPPDDATARNPRPHPITQDPPTSDGNLATLTAHLGRLVEAYTNRPALEALLRELEHLEDKARDVIDGPAKTNHAEPCPWCGHRSLVEHHRIEGRDTQLIRCEGTHPCECDWDWCGARCHVNPVRHRHEWINSGSQLHTWIQLRDLQNKRKELTMLETKALDALERIKALHQPFWLDPDGNARTNYVTVYGDQLPQLAPDHVCVDDGHWRCHTDPDAPDALDQAEHLVPACDECQHSNEDGDSYLIWPCPTYRLATELDQPTQEASS